MKQSVDFSKGRRGAIASNRGKTRITIYIDDPTIEHFRVLSEQTGKGYQTLINDALSAQIAESGRPLTASQVRKILREELAIRDAG
jgi:uncharacterized protein (DUF4415 family)